jgi:hypothetical protein
MKSYIQHSDYIFKNKKDLEIQEFCEEKHIIDRCPCLKNCCDKPQIDYWDGYSECFNCLSGCYCND